MILRQGIVTAIHPPSDPLNVNKRVYEYEVTLHWKMFTSVPTFHVIMSDPYGAIGNFRDKPLRPGSRVLVYYSNPTLVDGIIICCLRKDTSVSTENAGFYDRERFNKVEQLVDDLGNWSVTLDPGDNIQINTGHISLDNTTGESIYIDKAAKTITVNAGKDWVMQLGGQMTVNAGKDAVINCQNATVNAKQNVNVTGQQINLNSNQLALSPVTTNFSHQDVIDFITCIPVQGVPGVKAG